MGLIKGQIKIQDSQLELVYTEDPDVEPGTRKGWGWIPRGDAVRVGPNASVVTIRSPGPTDRDRYRDQLGRRGVGTAQRELVRSIVVEAIDEDRTGVRRKLKGAAALQWVDDLAMQAALALDLLANYGLALSAGQEPEWKSNRKLLLDEGELAQLLALEKEAAEEEPPPDPKSPAETVRPG